MNSRIWIWIVLIAWLIGGYLSWNWYTCQHKGFCNQQEVEQVAEKPIAVPEKKTFDPITFNGSDFKALTTEQLTDYRSDIIDNLEDGQTLEVVGNYTANEENNSAFENLGLARASAIKLLFSNFLDGNRIETSSQLIENDEEIDGSRFLAHTFNYLGGNVEKIGNEIIIRFPFNSTAKDYDPTVDAYLSKLSEKLKAEEISVSIMGHTDNVGDEIANYELGYDRAEAIQNVLLTNGAPGRKIKIKSEGETRPIASNKSENGRHKNRRVVIQIN